MNFIINSIVTSSLVVVVHRTLEIAKKTNFSISLLQIRAKLYHKLGNFLLPIGTSVITNLGQLHFITNWGRHYYKFGQLHFITNQGKCYYKLRQLFLLQIGAIVITNWGSLIITNQRKFYYKSGQLLQIRANVITNWGIAPMLDMFTFLSHINKHSVKFLFHIGMPFLNVLRNSRTNFRISLRKFRMTVQNIRKAAINTLKAT